MIYIDLSFTMIYPWWFSTRYFTTRNMLHFLANACARLAGTDLAAFISDALGVGHLQAATVCWVAKPNSQWISHMYTVYIYIYSIDMIYGGFSKRWYTKSHFLEHFATPMDLRIPHFKKLRVTALSSWTFVWRPPQRLTQQSSVLSQEPKGLFGPAGSMKPQMHFQDLENSSQNEFSWVKPKIPKIPNIIPKIKWQLGGTARNWQEWHMYTARQMCDIVGNMYFPTKGAIFILQWW